MAEFPDLDPKMHEALFRITDDMRRLKLNPESISEKEYCRILQDACGALTQSFEHGLKDAVLYPQNLANDQEMVAAANEIVGDLGRFSEFILIEKKVLLECGVSNEAADDILENVAQFREHYRADEYDADEIWKSVEGLRDGTCGAAEAAYIHFRSEDRLYEDKKKSMRTYGTALVAANLSALAVTAGASAPVSFVSSGFGGLLLTWTGYLKEPGSDRLE